MDRASKRIKRIGQWRAAAQEAPLKGRRGALRAPHPRFSRPLSRLHARKHKRGDSRAGGGRAVSSRMEGSNERFSAALAPEQQRHACPA